MQHLRSYGSNERKSHLTLDIALGLHALHSIGLVHGDIKPGNIILCDHPTRKVVAKISDFSGTGPASSYDSNPFITSTPTWQPPEVFMETKDIDWQLVDTYAFGMVVATMWFPRGSISGSFMDVLVSKFPPEQTAHLLQLCRFIPDQLPRCRRSSLAFALQYIPAEAEPQPLLPLRLLLASCLPNSPRSRCPLLKSVPLLIQKTTGSLAMRAW